MNIAKFMSKCCQKILFKGAKAALVPAECKGMLLDGDLVMAVRQGGMAYLQSP
jgi:hypothetical protein